MEELLRLDLTVVKSRESMTVFGIEIVYQKFGCNLPVIRQGRGGLPDSYDWHYAKRSSVRHLVLVKERQARCPTQPARSRRFSEDLSPLGT